MWHDEWKHCWPQAKGKSAVHGNEGNVKDIMILEAFLIDKPCH